MTDIFRKGKRRKLERKLKLTYYHYYSFDVLAGPNNVWKLKVTRKPIFDYFKPENPHKLTFNLTKYIKAKVLAACDYGKINEAMKDLQKVHIDPDDVKNLVRYTSNLKNLINGQRGPGYKMRTNRVCIGDYVSAEISGSAYEIIREELSRWSRIREKENIFIADFTRRMINHKDFVVQFTKDRYEGIAMAHKNSEERIHLDCASVAILSEYTNITIDTTGFNEPEACLQHAWKLKDFASLCKRLQDYKKPVEHVDAYNSTIFLEYVDLEKNEEECSEEIHNPFRTTLPMDASTYKDIERMCKFILKQGPDWDDEHQYNKVLKEFAFKHRAGWKTRGWIESYFRFPTGCDELLCIDRDSSGRPNTTRLYKYAHREGWDYDLQDANAFLQSVSETGPINTDIARAFIDRTPTSVEMMHRKAWITFSEDSERTCIPFEENYNDTYRFLVGYCKYSSCTLIEPTPLQKAIKRYMNCGSNGFTREFMWELQEIVESSSTDEMHSLVADHPITVPHMLHWIGVRA